MSKKKTSKPVKKEEPVIEPAPEETNAEWLIQSTMSGVLVMCSSCHAQLDITHGTLAQNILKNKYCYNCGSEMKIRDI